MITYAAREILDDLQTRGQAQIGIPNDEDASYDTRVDCLHPGHIPCVSLVSLEVILRAVGVLDA